MARAVPDAGCDERAIAATTLSHRNITFSHPDRRCPFQGAATRLPPESPAPPLVPQSSASSTLAVQTVAVQPPHLASHLSTLMSGLLGVRLVGSTRHENLNGVYLLEPDLQTNGCDVVTMTAFAAGSCRAARDLVAGARHESPLLTNRHETPFQFSKLSDSGKKTSYIYRNDKECWMVAPQKAHMGKNVGCIASIDAGAAS